MPTLRRLLEATLAVALGIVVFVGLATIAGVVVALSGGLRPSLLVVTVPLLVAAVGCAAVVAGYISVRNPGLSERLVGVVLAAALAASMAAIDASTTGDEGADTAWYFGVALFPAVILGVLLRAARRERVARRTLVVSAIATAFTTTVTIVAVVLGTGTLPATTEDEPSTPADTSDVQVDRNRATRGIFGVPQADGGIRWSM